MKTYPFYTKSPAHFYKVIDENTCVQVLTNPGSEAIGLYHAELAEETPYIETITENEFLEGFKAVSDIIRHKAMGTTPDQEKQLKREEKAGYYLSDGGDNNLAMQIELIEKVNEERPEERIYLDDIDGVNVWEDIQGRITAADFLAIINS